MDRWDREDRGKGQGQRRIIVGLCETQGQEREANEKRTNIHEFLGIRKGEFIADGGHDRLFARVEICIHPKRELDIRFSLSLTPPLLLTFGGSHVG
jgi:hypothetical protein